MIIRSRAPLRIGLAGGGTDVSPYSDIYGGYVLNGTIDRYAYTTIKIRDDKNVKFIGRDLELEKLVHITDGFQRDGILDLHTELYRVIMDRYNQSDYIPLEISTFCDAEAGSGLGSSSTIVVSMIQAYVEFLKLPLDYYTVAKLAYEVERINCGLNGGKQDQYSATFGGFNFMEFYEEDRTIINPLRLSKRIIAELECSLLLCYTGISRDSSKIISQQSDSLKQADGKSLTAMHSIKNEALIMKESLLTGQLDNFVASMQRGWESKKNSSSSVTNENINEVYEAAIEAGAKAGKISGAGGGGYMMLFTPIDRRIEVIKVIQERGLTVNNCHFVSRGGHAWRM